MHNEFTLFLRKYPNGKEVYFYYTYDEKGRRRGAWTTKSTTKTAARNYCIALVKKGALIPDRGKALTFREFAKGFWERGSEYVVYRDSRTDITDYYISVSRSLTEKQIVPVFGDTPLDKITADDVNKWLLGFSKREVIENGEKKIIQYRNSYANSVFRTFKTMLSEAVRRGLITENPCLKVQLLKNNRRGMELLTDEEVKRLFPEDYKTVWGNKEIAYAANRLASLTGMRSGEVLGLKGEFVFDKHIFVCGQFGRTGYLPHTKTKENRNIPLMPEMIALLRKLAERNGNGFLFSVNGGATPLCHTVLAKGLHDALHKISINKAEIKRRGITLHAWRHFVNTKLLQMGLSVSQVQSVTGHKSSKMTELYNHPDARQLAAVIEAQTAIAGIDQPQDGKPGDTPLAAKGKFGGLQIVKPDYMATLNRKRA